MMDGSSSTVDEASKGKATKNGSQSEGISPKARRKNWWTRPPLFKVNVARGVSKSRHNSPSHSFPVPWRAKSPGCSILNLNFSSPSSTTQPHSAKDALRLSVSPFASPLRSPDGVRSIKAETLCDVLRAEAPSVKRKYTDVVESPHDQPAVPIEKRQQLELDQNQDLSGPLSIVLSPSPTPDSQIVKKRQRRKEKKRRQKAVKRAEDEGLIKDKCSTRREGSLTRELRRFMVHFPLQKIGNKLSYGSVCKKFRKVDLDINNIVLVSLDEVVRSPEAHSVYRCLQRPLYFAKDCAEKMEVLIKSLGDSTISSRLKIIEQTLQRQPLEPHRELLPPEPLSESPILSLNALNAICDVLKDVQEPHRLESSQNSEDKIKYLLKPVLENIGFTDILVTNGWNWKEKIGLQSNKDQQRHQYVPKSDVAIVQLQANGSSKILVLFEVYSKCSQSNATPDAITNRAERVRLLLQGSHLSIRESRPSVVFYLTRDKEIETIIIFPEGGASAEPDKGKLCYYAEKRPFYSKASWVETLSQIINLVHSQRASSS